MTREARHRQDWETLGLVDPMWAVLSDPTKRGRRWDPSEFLASGEVTVDALLAIAGTFGRPARLGAALDFGCGPGRISRALATRFETVVGIDVAAPMIELARVTCESLSNVSFEVGDRRILAARAPMRFDLVVSTWVLQHLPTADDIRDSIIQLARMVAPDGLLVLQLPGPLPIRHRLQLRRRLFAALAAAGIPRSTLISRLGLSPIRMSGIRQRDVREMIIGAGLAVLDVRAEVISGSTIDSFTYYATRPPAGS